MLACEDFNLGLTRPNRGFDCLERLLGVRTLVGHHRDPDPGETQVILVTDLRTSGVIPRPDPFDHRTDQAALFLSRATRWKVQF